MPFNSRDMWVYLKAQDLATRALNSFGRSVRAAGNDVRIAQINAEQAAERARLAQGKLTGMTTANKDAIRANVAALEAEKASLISNDAQLATRSRNLEGLSSTLRSTSQAAYAAGFAITSFGVGGVIAMKNLIDASVEYDRQVRLTSTQISNFDGNFKRIGAIGLKVANDIGVGFKEIQPALYDIFSSIDINVPNAEKLLTAFAKAAVAGQTDIQSVSRGTLGILNSFRLGAESINRVLDDQFMFIKKGVGTYDEWAKRIGLVSPSAVRAGQSLEMMMAALAEASRMAGVAAKAGTAVARSFDAFSNPKAVDALKKIGISAVDAAGNFRPFVDVMFDFRKHLDKIPGEKEKIAAILDVFKGAGGTIEARRFLQNILLVHGSLEELQSILKDTANSAGSLDDAYGIMADSTAAKTQRLKNRWEEMKIALGDALIPVFNRFLDFGDKILNWFNNLDQPSKDAIANFLAMGTAISLIAGPLLLILGFLASFVAAVVTAGPEILAVAGIIIGLGAAISGLVGILHDAWVKSADFRGIFADLSDDIQVLWYVYLVPFGDAVKDTFEHHLMPAFKNLSDVINGQVIPAIRTFFYEFWEKHKGSIEEILNDLKLVIEYGFKALSWVINQYLIPAFKFLMDQYREHKKGIDQVIGVLQWLAKWFLIIAGATVIGVIIGAFIILIGVIGIIIGAVGALIWLIVKISEVFKQWGHDAMNLWRGLVEFNHNLNVWTDNLKGTVWNALKAVVGFFNSFGNWINNAVGDLGSVLWNAGKSVIEGFINGIRSMMNSLSGAIQSVINIIPPAVKRILGLGSPSKLFYDYGRNTIQGFINGINSMSPDLNKNMMGLSANFSPTINASLGSTNNDNNNNQRAGDIYITIHTQEIDPRQHAMELGRLLAGSI